ncbi:MAG TPA: hypothetical protein PKH79_00335 [Prolixibacteraceae bacterium]|nr:hypothetical protein [Prolixibacteraceae bacterium]HPS11650.1 hypothetical protein [Prolixibacteraceae bacterium]
MKTTVFFASLFLVIGLAACQSKDETSSGSNVTSSLKSTEITVNDTHVEGIACESQYEADLLSNSEKMLRYLANGYGKFNKYVHSKGGLRYQINHCPDVVIDTAEAGYPITIALNYGDSTVLKNGRILSGKVEIVISGPKNTDGTIRSITYTNFSVDSVVINGSVSELFNGDNTSTKTISLTDELTFLYPDGTLYTRVGKRVNNWLEGLDTELDPEDDKIEITGDVSVTNSLGESYSKTIIEPLIRLGSCKYYVQGITQITMNSEVISSINYGNGDCDNEATITVAGVDSTIVLNSGMPKHSNSSNSGQHKKGKK